MVAPAHRDDENAMSARSGSVEDMGTDVAAASGSETSARNRPKPGERRLQILQTLAAMLEEPGGERVTTAALAARLGVSEAALYRHFASKAQMYEGLIQFIEQSIFGLINQIIDQEPDPVRQLRAIVVMLLGFAQRNPGMTRVLIGDALVTEDDRLQERINQLLDRVEASLRQCVRNAVEQGALSADGPDGDPAARANLVVSYVLGRWMRFAKSGFRRPPADGSERQVALLIS
jgi:TetR/AcrR family transcriptional regulator